MSEQCKTEGIKRLWCAFNLTSMLVGRERIGMIAGPNGSIITDDD